jgi:hypothetical protein
MPLATAEQCAAMLDAAKLDSERPVKRRAIKA